LVVVGSWCDDNVDGRNRKKKSDEEAEKKQRMGFDGKVDLVVMAGFETQ
jgi:hypothetical protein